MFGEKSPALTLRDNVHPQHGCRSTIPTGHLGNKGTAEVQPHKQKGNSCLFRILGRFHLFGNRTVLVNKKLFRSFILQRTGLRSGAVTQTPSLLLL